jgi:hypothetical protein
MWNQKQNEIHIFEKNDFNPKLITNSYMVNKNQTKIGSSF